MPTTKTDYSKWIGYILFIVTLIGWGFSAGKFYSKLESMQEDIQKMSTKLEKQQDLLLEQQNFNGKIITYIEMTENEN